MPVLDLEAGGTLPVAGSTTGVVMTAIDEEVATQLVSTIQDWVNREVLPCAAEYEKADRYPSSGTSGTRH
jgi:hypothetical protein